MAKGANYSAARIANRIKALGREITRAAAGRRLDVVVTMDRAFMFAADLIREVDAPIVLHFVREGIRDIEQGGRARREVFFANRTGAERGGSERKEYGELHGCDVLLIDAVLDSGITQDFLLRRIGESRPRSLRLAVLLDKISGRRVPLEPDYFAFRTASKQMWSGYGLASGNGTGPNGKHLMVSTGAKKATGRGTAHRRKLHKS